jgi:hypothetical protein
MKLYHCGITIDVSAADAQRYLNAGYVLVEEKPVEIPANPQPEALDEVVEKPKARKTAIKKGN